MSDPKRWSDGAADAPPEMQSLLSSAPTPPPFTDAIRARTAARLAEQLPAPQHTPPLNNASRWILAAGGTAAIVAVVALAANTRTPSSRLPPPSLPAQELPAPVRVPVVVAPPPAATPNVVPSATVTPSAPTPPSTVRTRVVLPENPRAERDLLEAAQIALERAQDPTRALALLQQHRRSWPRSTMREEREYLTLRALVRAGQRDETLRRGTQFLRDFPHGIYTEPARRLLERNP